VLRLPVCEACLLRASVHGDGKPQLPRFRGALFGLEAR
jgi:hypothetical protein